MTVRLVTNEKIAETSSKGNQEKWLDNGQWYKLDQFGYEALTETFTSQLLEKSNIEHDYPFSFVRYRMELLNVHKRERIGCSSKNFLQEGQSIVTLSHLLGKTLEKPLVQTLERLTSDKKRTAYLADVTSEITGLEYFPQYLTLLFELDSLILNDDRHLNNIAVIEKNGKYDYCPIFDNGAGLLSNTQIYRMDIQTKALIHTVRSRPFNTTFNRQLSTVRELYHPQFKITKLTRTEIAEILSPLLVYYSERDRSIILDRVISCILERQKYI